MFKKLLLVTSVLSLFSANAVASVVPYVGIKLALDSGSWDFHNAADDTFHYGSNGEAIGIFGGLGEVFAQKYYVGGELFLNDSSTKTANKVIGLGTTARLRTTYSFGLSILPGIMLSPDTMLFARAGLVETQFILTQKPGGEQHTLATGGQAGIGLALSLGKNLDLRGEYTYSAYARFSRLGNKVSPRSNELSFGFVYKIV
jgi:hypothetical protein